MPKLIATFRRAQVDAAHKFGLIKAVETKGLKAMQAAIDTAEKAAVGADPIMTTGGQFSVGANSLEGVANLQDEGLYPWCNLVAFVLGEMGVAHSGQL